MFTVSDLMRQAFFCMNLCCGAAAYQKESHVTSWKCVSRYVANHTLEVHVRRLLLPKQCLLLGFDHLGVNLRQPLLPKQCLHLGINHLGVNVRQGLSPNSACSCNFSFSCYLLVAAFAFWFLWFLFCCLCLWLSGVAAMFNFCVNGYFQFDVLLFFC